MAFVTAFSRVVLPGIALIIFIKCILALWLGHPKEKTYGYIIDMLSGERYALNMWETSIGRAASCDITVSYDTVARIQAVFTRRIDGWYIYDIAPKSGIKVNGTKVEKKQTVQNGDIITLGSIKFRFEVVDDPVVRVGKKKKNNKAKGSAPAANQPPHNTPVYDIDRRTDLAKENDYGDGNSYTVDTPDREEREKPKGPSQPKIVNKDTGEAFILCGNEVTIGSGRRSDIRLSSRETAKNHAILILYEDGWAIDDVSGEKGTYLNGRKVTSPQLLFEGDIIALGDERLFFEAGRKI